MGNPQCVQLVDALPDDARFDRLGPALSTHRRFAAGTNVEVSAVIDSTDAPAARSCVGKAHQR